MRRLQKNIVIVTGGASGIGQAIVRKFAHHGATVILADIQTEPAVCTVNEVTQSGGRAQFIETDLRDLEQIDALVRHMVKQFGRVDIMVPNAGLQYENAVADTTEAEYDHIMNVNLKGMFFCCKSAVAVMLGNGGGDIVAIGSALSLVAEPHAAACCTSKAGALNLVRSIATDYGRNNIRANCVYPGYIDTPLNDRYFQQQADPVAVRQAAVESNPLGRIGHVDEVAKYVSFLARKEASFVTGASLIIDGAA